METPPARARLAVPLPLSTAHEQHGLDESPGLLGKQRHARVILSGSQLHILWLSPLP